MKKIISLFSVLSLVLFASCSEDDSNNIPQAYFFTTESSSFIVEEDGNDFVELKISSTIKSNVDRTVTVSVDGEASTATPAQYNLESTQVVIPAGAFESNTTIKVSGNYEALPETGIVNLVLKISDDLESLSDKKTSTVSLTRPCIGLPVSLAFVFDFYASETTWQVKSAAGAVLYSGGPYADGSAPLTVPMELCAGAYSITVNDAYADGMFDGTNSGSFTVIQNGATLATGGGNFGATTTVNFTVN